MNVSELPQSKAVFPSGLSARCLFCAKTGVGWWGCNCEWAVKIHEGELPKPKTVVRNGIPIIECCSELREAARGAAVIKVTDEPSSAVGQTEPPKLQTEPPRRKLSHQTEPPPRKSEPQTEPPTVETEPPAGRDAKRDRILAKILLNPAASDRAIASELGVSRNTVKAIRAMVKRD